MKMSVRKVEVEKVVKVTQSIISIEMTEDQAILLYMLLGGLPPTDGVDAICDHLIGYSPQYKHRFPIVDSHVLNKSLINPIYDGLEKLLPSV